MLVGRRPLKSKVLVSPYLHTLSSRQYLKIEHNSNLLHGVQGGRPRDRIALQRAVPRLVTSTTSLPVAVIKMLHINLNHIL